MNAYEKVYKALQTVIVSMPGGLGRYPGLYDVVWDALKTKPRNCDVGTAEEQGAMFEAYCNKEVCNRKNCGCSCKALYVDECALEWAQMPYEEGGER